MHEPNDDLPCTSIYRAEDYEDVNIQPAEDDEIMAEIYRIRLAMLARFGGDFDLMMDHIERSGRNRRNPRVSYVEESRKPKDGQRREPIE